MMAVQGLSRRCIAADRALRDATKGPLLRMSPLFLERLTPGREIAIDTMTEVHGPSRRCNAVGRPLRDATNGPLLGMSPLFLKRLILRSEPASVSKGPADRIGEIFTRGLLSTREV
jgi:hypothetical protein